MKLQKSQAGIVKFKYKLNKNSSFFDELILKCNKEEFLFNLYLNFTIPHRLGLALGSCAEKEYFKLSESKCQQKLNELEACSYDEMCLEPMFCSIPFGCRCPRYYFYENVTSSCTNQLVNDATCNKDHECRQDLGLRCQNGKCWCSSSKYTWSSSSHRCRLTYQQSICTGDSECNDSEKLKCQLAAPSGPSYRTCDCTKEENDENYWDGSKCIEANTYRSSCSTNEHCKTLTENTFCSSFSNKCECPDFHYWNGQKCMMKKSNLGVCYESKYFDVNVCVDRRGELEACFSTEMCLKDMICNNSHCVCNGDNYYVDKCIPQKLINQRCDKDLECWSSKGLICEWNNCVCKSSYTWSITESKCLLTYGQKGCGNNNECNTDENLMCIDEDCNCEIESEGNMCDCSRNSIPEQYWNGSQCIDAREFNFPCTHDYQCRTNSQKTLCINSSCVCSDFSNKFTGFYVISLVIFNRVLIFKLYVDISSVKFSTSSYETSQVNLDNAGVVKRRGRPKGPKIKRQKLQKLYC
ncbi:prion-like-(Q N-rich) domain-bearing 25 [Brachionus plicatilis]|uniref:Prion-like-(Q N-rich) domain-bearing 25 n=1 Tax=Brachionus plicatilis TaxID=10195 RepID=A0A3M7P3L8_BRAPC|nr:prion-like-(Q N-rich) domain-bearing 25 [Brachionus plicatilis]